MCIYLFLLLLLVGFLARKLGNKSFRTKLGFDDEYDEFENNLFCKCLLWF